MWSAIWSLGPLGLNVRGPSSQTPRVGSLDERIAGICNARCRDPKKPKNQTRMLFPDTASTKLREQEGHSELIEMRFAQENEMRCKSPSEVGNRGKRPQGTRLLCEHGNNSDFHEQFWFKTIRLRALPPIDRKSDVHLCGRLLFSCVRMIGFAVGFTRIRDARILNIRATVEIPEADLDEPMRLTRATTKKADIVAAVREFNRKLRLAELVKYAGTCEQLVSVE